MPEKLIIEVSDGIVRASVSGVFSLDNAKAFFNEMLRRAREEGINRILIDARGLTTEMPTIERYEFGGHMVEQGAHAFKIAFVGTDDQVWHDRFLETVSVNRGLNAKSFTEIDEARDWLAK